jgi:hypothetical protein
VTTTDPFTPCWEPVCGNPGCGGWRVDDNVVSLGTGVSDLNGRRSDPCWVCAQAWKAQHPTDETYPSGPVETRDPHRYVINRIGYGAHHRLPHLEVRDPSPRQHDFLVGFILASHCDDPRYVLRRTVGAFLQGESPEWIFIEFWNGEEKDLAIVEAWLNANYPLEEVELCR